MVFIYKQESFITFCFNFTLFSICLLDCLTVFLLSNQYLCFRMTLPLFNVVCFWRVGTSFKSTNYYLKKTFLQLTVEKAFCSTKGYIILPNLPSTLCTRFSILIRGFFLINTDYRCMKSDKKKNKTEKTWCFIWTNSKEERSHLSPLILLTMLS